MFLFRMKYKPRYTSGRTVTTSDSPSSNSRLMLVRNDMVNMVIAP